MTKDRPDPPFQPGKDPMGPGPFPPPGTPPPKPPDPPKSAARITIATPDLEPVEFELADMAGEWRGASTGSLLDPKLWLALDGLLLALLDCARDGNGSAMSSASAPGRTMQRWE